MASARKKAPKTRLQALFIKRVEEELERLQISRNELCGRVGAPKQSTFNEIMNGADPRLEQIQKISDALGVHACDLLTESSAVGESLHRSANVRKLPTYPPMIGQQAKPSGHKSHDRRRRRA